MDFSVPKIKNILNERRDVRLMRDAKKYLEYLQATYKAFPLPEKLELAIRLAGKIDKKTSPYKCKGLALFINALCAQIPQIAATEIERRATQKVGGDDIKAKIDNINLLNECIDLLARATDAVREIQDFGSMPIATPDIQLKYAMRGEQPNDRSYFNSVIDKIELYTLRLEAMHEQAHGESENAKGFASEADKLIAKLEYDFEMRGFVAKLLSEEWSGRPTPQDYKLLGEKAKAAGVAKPRFNRIKEVAQRLNDNAERYERPQLMGATAMGVTGFAAATFALINISGCEGRNREAPKKAPPPAANPAPPSSIEKTLHRLLPRKERLWLAEVATSESNIR